MLFISLKLLLPSFLGAVGQEVLHWYNLSKSLGNNVKLFSSKSYWIITTISIIFFGLTASYLSEFINIPKIEENTKLFITGLFYPLIAKQLLKIVTIMKPNRIDQNGHRESDVLIKSLKKKDSFNPKDYITKY
ncbi:hypothetical protein SAMN04487765_3472 [Tenacibaculum sp. MAR_2010_89]|uniref:hypothetical protein n=1 Tax=Tenacibaculum sp. MAR_2010_89 TaxID=1250198 RepID=UPI0008972393|nr:hypothetical protein [Tenacibaculum sp. MAR_2010_89]SEE62997.1 hypothetical protein SAMN04487765_3472 [Tenacibaculum sp. MAR_2010_89]